MGRTSTSETGEELVVHAQPKREPTMPSTHGRDENLDVARQVLRRLTDEEFFTLLAEEAKARKDKLAITRGIAEAAATDHKRRSSRSSR